MFHGNKEWISLKITCTDFENGITICLRFNFMTLIGSIVFKHDRPGSPSMFEGQANYRQTFFFFGSMNWIIKDVELNSFLVWSTNRWHSICVAFDRTTSHITFVKVKINLRVTSKSSKNLLFGTTIKHVWFLAIFGDTYYLPTY